MHACSQGISFGHGKLLARVDAHRGIVTTTLFKDKGGCQGGHTTVAIPLRDKDKDKDKGDYQARKKDTNRIQQYNVHGSTAPQLRDISLRNRGP